MANPNIKTLDGPLPGWRGTRSIALAGDLEFDAPVAIQAVDAGNIHYEDAEGNAHVVTLEAGGTIIGPANGFIYVQKIFAAQTTVNTVIAGIT